jgi:hypothetical protein
MVKRKAPLQEIDERLRRLEREIERLKLGRETIQPLIVPDRPGRPAQRLSLAHASAIHHTPTAASIDAGQGKERAMARLWRNNPAVNGPKYLVQRRDGTVPEWPYFVLGARDPAAPTTLVAYAMAAEALGLDKQYVADIKQLAVEFEQYRMQHGAGDPDGPPHRKDDPATIAKMAAAKGA